MVRPPVCRGGGGGGMVPLPLGLHFGHFVPAQPSPGDRDRLSLQNGLRKVGEDTPQKSVHATEAERVFRGQ